MAFTHQDRTFWPTLLLLFLSCLPVHSYLLSYGRQYLIFLVASINMSFQLLGSWSSSRWCRIFPLHVLSFLGRNGSREPIYFGRGSHPHFRGRSCNCIISKWILDGKFQLLEDLHQLTPFFSQCVQGYFIRATSLPRFWYYWAHWIVRLQMILRM
jgi:hypothetical protein